MIKYNIAVLLLVIAGFHVAKSQVYVASSSEISFFSEAPQENIEALNKKSSSLLNTKTKQLVFQVPIGAFDFEKDLMEEHFNENYMETEKYPKATFNGTIKEGVDFEKDGIYKAQVSGKLTIHGVTKDRSIDGEITVKDGAISLKSQFAVKLEEHNVAIPKVVVLKIAEEVLVTIKAAYSPYKKKE